MQTQRKRSRFSCGRTDFCWENNFQIKMQKKKKTMKGKKRKKERMRKKDYKINDVITVENRQHHQ